MSDTENSADGETVLSVEYKGGQLQVVEVSHFGTHIEEGSSEGTHILSDFSENDQEPRFILDPEKGLVQLDMLNLTLVRCENDEDTYRLVAANTSGEEPQELVNCVLQSSDGEDGEQAYVMVEEDDNTLVMMNPHEESIESLGAQKTEAKQILSPVELLEKAKAYQRAKAKLIKCHSEPGRRGRKRKCELPPAHELLASPNFKLYLYSCKLCPFKCNIVKELTEHKALEHGAGAGGAGAGGSRGARGAGRGAGAHGLQCARCPFRASMHSQLMKHVEEHQVSVSLEDVEVLVCGACGFESASREAFSDHVRAHAA